MNPTSRDKRHPLSPLADRVGHALARTGVAPNAVTLAALGVSAVGAWLVYGQRYVAGSLVLLVGASLDSLDGAVARAAGRTTRAGGYLDSLVDRFVDFGVLLAIMAGVDTFRMWVWGSVALFGALLTSGAKWRVHEDLHPTREVWGPDLLERPGRYLLLLPGLLAQGLLDHWAVPSPVLFLVVVLVAVLGVLTVFQRMAKALRLLRRSDDGTKGP